jgi:CheY-like chemotaxis protein
MATEAKPIIIVEDDPFDREILSIALRKLEFNEQVFFFSDGDSLLQWAKENTGVTPLCIISDNLMPRMNGLELKAEIDNSGYYKEREVPFVIMSGTEIFNADNILEKHKINGFLIKRFSFKETQDALEKLIKSFQESHKPEII